MSNDLVDWYTRAAILLFAIIVLLIGWDVLADYQERVNLSHMAIEFSVMSAAAGGTVLLWLQLRRAQSDLARVTAHIRENQSMLSRDVLASAPWLSMLALSSYPVKVRFRAASCT